MKKQKGSGLLISVIIAAFISVTLFVFLKKIDTVGVDIEWVDPDKSVIEQSGDFIDKAREVKEMIEQKNNIDEYLQ